MKRILAVLLLGLALTFTLAACSSNDEPAVTPTPAPPSATPGNDGAGGTMPGGDVTDDDTTNDGIIDDTAPPNTISPEGSMAGTAGAAVRPTTPRRDTYADGDDTGRTAGDVARNAVDGVGDVARGVVDGVGDMARDVGNGVKNAMR